MITTEQLTVNLKAYIDKQIASMAKTNPAISFMRPLITRALDKNFNKVGKLADLIADEKGNIDIASILDEMIENTLCTEPFTINSPMGDIEIGEGLIKIELPLVNKKVVLNQEDLQVFKEMLITKR